MLVLNLACGQNHAFEGWFGSAEDFDSQRERGLIQCPICANAEIERRPSAPRINVAHPRGEAKEPTPQQLQQAVQDIVRHVKANTEDVGERFAEEARRIHYDEAPARAIRGQTSLREAAELTEEGIAVLPLPAMLKEPLQ